MRRVGKHRRKKPKKILIITSLSLLLFLCVGYAAFNTNLTMKAKGNIKQVDNAASTIKKLLETNSNELYIDNHGDIRYYGDYYSTNNYVTFNNEPWRIIGVIDGKVKIVKKNYIPTVLYSDGIEVGTNICYNTFNCQDFMQWNTQGTNNWATSTLQIYLNSTYYNNIESNFRDMISEETYYLGAPTTSAYSSLNALQYYDIERSNQIYVGNQSTIIRNIGLPYVSDILYSAGETHLNENVSQLIGSNTYFGEPFLINAFSNVSDQILAYYSDGGAKHIHEAKANETDGSSWIKYSSPYVYPTLYLKSEVKIVSGMGSETDPFILE